MDYLDELYLYGETTLTYRGDSTRYVLRQANAVPAFAVLAPTVDRPDVDSSLSEQE